VGLFPGSGIGVSHGAAGGAPVLRSDPQKYPSHKLSQIYANCQLYQGDEGSATGGCALFGGKDIAAKGWCSAWERG